MDCCEKCDTKVPDEYLNGNPPDELWVECSCSAHPGWYCPNHSPGNDCFDDEDCDCCKNKMPTQADFITDGRSQFTDLEVEIDQWNRWVNRCSLNKSHSSIIIHIMPDGQTKRRKISFWGIPQFGQPQGIWCPYAREGGMVCRSFCGKGWHMVIPKTDC
jgi:hypothetical protein